MATGGDDRTLDFYTREAPVYAGFAAEAEDSRFLTAFTDMLPTLSGCSLNANTLIASVATTCTPVNERKHADCFRRQHVYTCQ